MAISISGSKIALQRTLVALTSTRLRLKNQKSKSAVIIKGGGYIDEQPLQVAGEIIPSLHKEPLKTLGRVYNSSVTD